jgi:flagellar basal-body rod protein FlgB
MPINPGDMIPYLEAGIKAGSLRSKAIANNIANLRTENYRRIDVKFEDVLKDRLSDDEPLDLTDATPELIRPMTTPVASNGNDVDIDSEVAAMMQNTGKLKFYLSALRKNYQMIDSAMRTE